jgi:hypothetical protein
MATTYVQRLTSLIPAGKKNALESQFVQIIGRQIRAPYPTRHPPAKVIEQIKELYAWSRGRRATSSSSRVRPSRAASRS